jgi:hypothetical protein
MWSRSTRLAVALVLAGCGARQLAIGLTLDPGSCTLMLPAGSSLLYQVTANGSAGDGGSGSFCGACLAVDADITGSDALIAFVRQHAPSCAGVHPNTLLGVRLTAWSAPDCPEAMPLAFCIEGPTVLVPNGTSDASLNLSLTCHAQCATQCVPTSCAAQAKDCGPISDGCNNLLECGTCKPPLHCGAGGMPNVCGR